MASRRLTAFVAALGAEVNTFAPLPINEERFAEVCLIRAHSFRRGDDVPLIAAPLKRALELEEAGSLRLVQGLLAGAQPGGLVTRSAYENLRDTLLSDLDEALSGDGGIDLVLLGLHGATVAEGYDDCEGDLLKRIRDKVGPEVFIGALLDPHGHLSPNMLRYADLMTAYKEYPHTDIFPEAARLVDMSVACTRSVTRPSVAAVHCNTIQVIHTTHGKGKEIIADLRDNLRRDDVLDISIAHSFPWGDTPDTGTAVWASVMPSSSGDEAAGLAGRIAGQLITARAQTRSAPSQFDQVLEAVRSRHDKPVIIADSADNPGGGSPSDGTQLIQELMDRGVRRMAAGFLWDPGAVALCQAAGEGAVMELRIGGKASALSGTPLDLEVTVGILLGETSQNFAGSPWPVGDAVAVHAQGLALVLTSRRTQCFDADLFIRLGIDLASKDAVVVKSSQHFRASFEPIGSSIHYYEGEGALGAVESLPYEKVRRPIWPLDSEEPYAERYFFREGQTSAVKPSRSLEKRYRHGSG